jgi:hypothetical protein
VIDPCQPTRSAITVAGISGYSVRIVFTLASNGVNDVEAATRSYRGGRSDRTAAATVARAMPRSLATCRCGTPSATSRRINAQSSTEITHPICLGGRVFERRYGLTFERRPHGEILDGKGILTLVTVGVDGSTSTLMWTQCVPAGAAGYGDELLSRRRAPARRADDRTPSRQPRSCPAPIMIRPRRALARGRATTRGRVPGSGVSVGPSTRIHICPYIPLSRDVRSLRS